MSFMFKWPKEWNQQIIEKIKNELEEKINSIEHGITLLERVTIPVFDLGTTPPKLELVKINEMTSTGTSSVFHLKYQGNAKLSFKTKANLSPLTLGTSSLLGQLTSTNKDPSIIPFVVSIEDIVLDGKIKVCAFYNLERVIEGEELKLKLAIFLTNNPMKNIKITTDIPFVQGFMQNKVEEIIENLSKNLIEEGIKIDL